MREVAAPRILTSSTVNEIEEPNDKTAEQSREKPLLRRIAETHKKMKEQNGAEKSNTPLFELLRRRTKPSRLDRIMEARRKSVA